MEHVAIEFSHRRSSPFYILCQLAVDFLVVNSSLMITNRSCHRGLGGCSNLCILCPRRVSSVDLVVFPLQKIFLANCIHFLTRHKVDLLIAFQINLTLVDIILACTMILVIDFVNLLLLVLKFFKKLLLTLSHLLL